MLSGGLYIVVVVCALSDFMSRLYLSLSKSFLSIEFTNFVVNRVDPVLWK